MNVFIRPVPFYHMLSSSLSVHLIQRLYITYEADENCTPLGYYVESSGNLLSKRNIGKKFSLLADVGKELPLLAA